MVKGGIIQSLSRLLRYYHSTHSFRECATVNLFWSIGATAVLVLLVLLVVSLSKRLVRREGFKEDNSTTRIRGKTKKQDCSILFLLVLVP